MSNNKVLDGCGGETVLRYISLISSNSAYSMYVRFAAIAQLTRGVTSGVNQLSPITLRLEFAVGQLDTAQIVLVQAVSLAGLRYFPFQCIQIH